MAFVQKYPIQKHYLTAGTKRRPGIPMPKVDFIVAHDTGDPGATAEAIIKYYENSRNQMSASAHTFIDDKNIIECIPLLTGKPEKAWHVRYNAIIDNKMYGDDANDVAGGVELCWGGNINFQEAYKRYVWYLAYACYKFGLNPAKHIVGHEVLDPGRKIDPSNGLKHGGKTYRQLLNDVVAEYNACLKDNNSTPVSAPVQKEITTDYVVVKEGDTLWSIAQEHKGITVNDLIKFNPHLNPQALQVGQKVYLKPQKEVHKPIKKPVFKYDLPHKVLKKGDKGPDVLAVQKALVAVRFYPDKTAENKGCDGVYGPKTENAVMRFQSVYCKPVDGVYGPEAEKALEKLLNK